SHVSAMLIHRFCLSLCTIFYTIQHTPFFLKSTVDHRDLHSFPTRRSSDLNKSMKPPGLLLRDLMLHKQTINWPKNFQSSPPLNHLPMVVQTLEHLGHTSGPCSSQCLCCQCMAPH